MPRRAPAEPDAAVERRAALPGAPDGLAPAPGGPPWLRALRDAGRARYAAHGLPKPQDEEWRNTNLAPLAEIAFRSPDPARSRLPELPPLATLSPDAVRLVFVDGRFAPAHASRDRLPPGVRVESLAALLAREPELLAEHLAGVARPTAELRDLNDALFEDGGVVLIPAGVRLERPVHLVFVSGASGECTASHPRTLILAARDSSVTVVESYLGVGSAAYLTNAVSEVRLGPGARVARVRVQAEGEAAFHVSTDTTRQDRDSELVHHSIDLGARLARHNLVSILDGAGARCSLHGLYLTRGTQHVDNHTVLDHAQPHCGSREVYKGILDGDSRAAFSGRIIVRPQAQQTDAKQSNRNLLLSSRALAHTRPQLEIHADDVKCTHGATIGRVDDEAMFYLRSRGIDGTAARNLLVQAFAREVLDSIGPDPLREALEHEVASRLPGSDPR